MLVVMEYKEERNIILLGKLGAGKSHSGNGILGLKNHFESEQSFASCTRTCAYGSAIRNGIKYRVFDTPGVNSFKDVKNSIDVDTEIKRCLFSTSPGFHALVLVLAANERITEEDLKIVKKLEEILENKGYNYMMLVVTKMNDDKETLARMIEESEEIKFLAGKCHNRQVIFGNDANNIPDSCLQTFYAELEKLVKENRKNGAEYFKHQYYEKANEILQKDKDDFMKAHPNVRLSDAMEEVRLNAALGKSPRDKELTKLTASKDPSCCGIS